MFGPRTREGGIPQQIGVPLFAGVIGLGVGLFLFLGQVRQVKQLNEQLRVSQQQVTKLQDDNRGLTEEVAGLQSAQNRLENRLSSLQTQLSVATTDVDRSRTALEELRGRYDEANAERAQLQTHVVTLTNERNEARLRLEVLEEKKTELERATVRLRERLTLLDRDYRQLGDKLAQLQANPPSSVSIVSAPGPFPSSTPASNERLAAMSTIPGTVELPPIIVRKDQAGMAIPVRARLLEVNEPHNFVVIDKGSGDGVRVGMAFDVLRGSQSVGRATVVRVRPQLSACDIVRIGTPTSLQPGDTAVQSGP